MNTTGINNDVSIKPSTYDTLVAALTALIALKAVAVLCLFLVWMVQDSSPQSIGPGPSLPPPFPIEPDESPSADDPEAEPGAKEFPEIEPDLKLVDEINLIDDQVSTVLAEKDPAGGRGDSLAGDQDGRDGGDDVGPGPGGTLLVPDFKRWKITFQIDDKETYKRMLDQFGIHIGVASNDTHDVWRVADVSKQSRTTESTRETEKGTLMFLHTRPQLRKWDFDIATDAGVPVTNKFVLTHFYPQQLRAEIAALEAAWLNAADRELEAVVRTNLRVQAGSDGFEFVVESCEYR